MAMQRSGNMNQEEELEMALRLSQQQVSHEWTWSLFVD